MFCFEAFNTESCCKTLVINSQMYSTNSKYLFGHYYGSGTLLSTLKYSNGLNFILQNQDHCNCHFIGEENEGWKSYVICVLKCIFISRDKISKSL
jgi:hypothetical protein